MSGEHLTALLSDFLLEAYERIEAVEHGALSLLAATEDERLATLTAIARDVHTVKGSAGMLGLDAIRTLAHALEDVLAAIDRKAPRLEPVLEAIDGLRAEIRAVERQAIGEGAAAPAPTGALHEAEALAQADLHLGSVRVPFGALDALVEQLAEMVIFRNRLSNAVTRGRAKSPGDRSWDEVDNAEAALGKTLSFIQDRVMQLRMVPLSLLLRQLQRIVHDEGTREGKSIELHTSAADTPMDKALLEVAGGALGHLVRNAVVHGIERPDERARAGKPTRGNVRIEAATEHGEVRIDVVDDGRGIDAERLVAAARARGIPWDLGADPIELLFLAGFSTKDDVDVAAGRGVGLSAVRDAIAQLGGRVEVHTRLGAGSRFRIRLPLSVSIARALLLRADGEEYALPLHAVVESARFDAAHGHSLHRVDVMRWRGALLPLIDLGRCFGTASAARARGYVAVIEADGHARGLVVDEIAGMRDIVVRGLDPLVSAPEAIAGATILGDGRVVLILDPRQLAMMRPSTSETKALSAGAPREEPS